jgi:hypothetical protein
MRPHEWGRGSQECVRHIGVKDTGNGREVTLRSVATFLFCAALLPLVLSCQTIIDGANLPAVQRQFETQPGETRLTCKVQPIKPVLNFGFRFQSGYVFDVPMSQYLGAGHFWVILTRVTPDEGDRTTVYFANSLKLPDIPRTKAHLEFGGGYFLGEGRYKVEFALLDDTDRACRKTWHVEGKLGSIDRRAPLHIASNTVGQFFAQTRTAVRGGESGGSRPLRVSVLLHAAPLAWWRTKLRASDRLMLLGSLSSLVEIMAAESVRVSVFNLDQQKELFEIDRITNQTFDRIAQAMNDLELGTVDYRVLRNRRGHMDVLADLLNRELSAKQPPDAVIVLGPTTRYIDKPRESELASNREATPKFYYFQYQPNRRSESRLPDSIENAIRKLHGKTMIVRTPKDFAEAIARVKQQLAPSSALR